MPEIIRSLYAHPTGWWAIIEKPQGIVAPPTIQCHQPLAGPVELVYQGTADDTKGRSTLAECQRRLAALTATPPAADEPAGRRLMDITEFRRFGYLQEVNRQFLHPLGLALAVHVADDGTESLSGVWDDRDDPEGIRYAPDVIDRQKAARVLDAQRRMADSRMPVLGYVMQPADAGPHPDTLPHASGILGRALRGPDGELWPQAGPDRWREPAGTRPYSRYEIEADYGRTEVVLLVDPTAWEQRERVIQAAWDWHADWKAGQEPTDDDLAAAVDALTGDPEHAEVEPEPVTWRDIHEAMAAGEPVIAASADVEVVIQEQPAEPAPEPTGDRPGWDRDIIREALDDMSDREASHVRALLAERDQLERDLEHARADRQDLWDTRDKRNHRWMEAAERYQTERDAARAELAEVTTQREHFRQQLGKAAILGSEYIAKCEDLRAELAEVTAERDSWRAGAELAESRVDELRAELDHHREITREVTAALPPGADLTLPIGEQVRQAQATARRDTAAAGVLLAKELLPLAVHEDLEELSDQVRTGQRDVPGTAGGSDE